MRLLRYALPLAVVVAAPAQGATLLRLDGIGPLKLKMTRTAALDTGWLGGRGTGCELGGPPLPITYKFTGAKAPAGVRGTVEFNKNKLTSFAFDKGVRTATGVVVGKTTVGSMVTRYRNAGFKASSRYDSTFQGTFVTIRRKKGGPQVLGGFAAGKTAKVVTTLGLPFVPVCD
jgi:hypothetical protein